MRPAPLAVQIFVKEMVAQYGPRRAAQELGLSPYSLRTVVDGLPIQRAKREAAVIAARARGVEV